MTIEAAAPRSTAAHRIDLRPSATAMVWLGAGHRHEAVAVPGVSLLPGDVLVAIELATICGSDVHTASGHRPAPTPLVLGHEHVGRITHLTPGGARDVDGEELNIGDRIVWSIAIGCGTCDRCARGIGQKCRTLKKYGHERLVPGWELSGGFATHMQLKAGTAIVRVAEDQPAEVLAPVSCGTATAWAALAGAEQAIGREPAVILVLGAGLIGLTATAIAHDHGARVIVSDPDPARRELALRFGATAAIDPGDGRPALEVALAPLGVDGPDAVVEASGSPRAVAFALDAVDVGGAVILVGSVFPTQPVPLAPEQLVRGLVTVRGVHNYTADDLRQAAAYIRTRGASWPFRELVGSTVELAQLDDGIALAQEGGVVRVGVRPPGV